jgi:hypothetical protein
LVNHFGKRSAGPNPNAGWFKDVVKRPVIRSIRNLASTISINVLIIALKVTAMDHHRPSQTYLATNGGELNNQRSHT